MSQGILKIIENEAIARAISVDSQHWVSQTNSELTDKLIKGKFVNICNYIKRFYLLIFDESTKLLTENYYISAHYHQEVRAAVTSVNQSRPSIISHPDILQPMILHQGVGLVADVVAQNMTM